MPRPMKIPGPGR